MPSPPILETIAHDPVLGRCKLIAEAWDAGGLYQVGSFPSWKRWSEWNGRYRDTLRALLKGTADAAPEMYLRIRGSEDLYSVRSSQASINFVTCHDGFTLRDLVSYNEKHNMENGEENRDGSNDNCSWNCGVEGDTEDPQILALRMRQMKNALTILLTSRGIPMLLAGDEFANTQSGNNNAYCQDNEISYLNWEDLDRNRDLYDYVRNLIAFRKAHPILRSASYDFSHNDTGYPELSFHGCDPWCPDESAPNLTFAYLYAEGARKYRTERDSFLYIAVNAHWETHTFHLPIIPSGMRWHLAFDASGDSFAPGQERPLDYAEDYTLGPRTSAVLVAR
jgi:glycogen operon protein